MTVTTIGGPDRLVSWLMLAALLVTLFVAAVRIYRGKRP